MFYDIKKIASAPETLLITSMNIRLLWWKYGQTSLKWSLKLLGEFGEDPRLVIYCIAYGWFDVC